MRLKQLMLLSMTIIGCALLQTGCTFNEYNSASGSCGPNLQWTLNYETGVLEITGSGPMYSRYYGVFEDEFKPLIKSVIMSEGVTDISGYAFSSCYNLTSVIIPQSVTRIEDNAFSSCYSLPNVTIPNNVTTIEEDAFEYCYSLTSVTIGSGVAKIGDRAFYDCEALKKIICLAITPPSCGYDVFNMTHYGTLMVPAGSVSRYENSRTWGRFNIQPISE